MAKITRTQRRLVASSIALILMAAMMIPTTTDARGGGGGGGHGGGSRGPAGVLGLTNLHPTNPSPGISVGKRFTFSSSHSSAHPMSFAHRSVPFGRSRRVASHFITFGADGAWVDNFVYAPNVIVAQQPATVQQPAERRASVVRTPGPARSGILVVRGDSKSYVTFPSRARG